MLKAYFLIAISGLSVLPVALSAEEQTATWVNTYGVSGGLIDMPTAEVVRRHIKLDIRSA